MKDKKLRAALDAADVLKKEVNSPVVKALEKLLRELHNAKIIKIGSDAILYPLNFSDKISFEDIEEGIERLIKKRFDPRQEWQAKKIESLINQNYKLNKKIDALYEYLDLEFIDEGNIPTFHAKERTK